MKKLIEYQDYRLYLKDLINEQKTLNKKYSLIYYSKKIKTSDSYLKQVINNKRGLNLDKAFSLAKALGLSPSEKAYFITLIVENESSEPDLKRFFKNQLSEYSKSNIPYTKNQKMTAIFENNLLWEIFSIIGLENFRNDPLWIQTKLLFKSPLVEIQKTIEFLLKVNAIEIYDNKLKASNIVVPHKFNPKFAYIAALKRAIQFLQLDSKINSEYTFESFCLILSNNQFKEIQAILEDAKIKIGKIASNKDEKKTLISYLNLNIFPVSK